jgi:hypothetical protein
MATEISSQWAWDLTKEQILNRLKRQSPAGVVQAFDGYQGEREKLLLYLLENLSTERADQLLTELLRAAGQAEWCFRATEALDTWPLERMDTKRVVLGLRHALHAALNPANPHSIGPVSKSLLRLPRTEEDDADITAGLRQGLRDLQENDSEQPWHHHDLMLNLLNFGDLDSLDPDAMSPSGATQLHWKRTGITWPEAARLLAQAQAVDPVAPERLAHSFGETASSPPYLRGSSSPLTGGLTHTNESPGKPGRFR